MALQVGGLGRGVFGLLVYAGDAQPVGADAEGGADAARSRGVVVELVPCQRRDFQWRRGGSEQQNPSGNQTIVWLPHLQRYGNSLVSQLRPAPRAGISPQILLTRLFFTGSRNGPMNAM